MKLDLTNPTQCTEAPVTALRLDETFPLTFAEKPQASDDQSSREITMLARTPEPLYHWWWGWCVHDFNGMQSKKKIPLDYCHDDDELIGFADDFPVDKQGLTVKGRIESIDPDDEAAKILKRADRGIPYEASIYFQPLLLEYVMEGASADVNGNKVQGPCTIFREWRLRAVAVCPHGYDYGSNTSLKADDQSTCKLQWKETPMSNATPATPATSATPAAAPATATTDNKSQLAAPTREDFQKELKRYTDRFGAADGAEYLSSGLSWEASLEKHAGKLQSSLDAAVKRAEEAESKLQAAKLTLGESSGIDTGAKGTNGNSKPTSFQDLVKPKS
jgi:hypothetical protein